MKPPVSAADGSPERRLTLFDTTCIIVGIVIGSSIFQSSPFIAYNVSRPSVDAYSVWVSVTEARRGLTMEEARNAAYMGTAGWEYDLVCGAGLQFAWATGGLIALVGALCFAELATTYPQEGGTFVYLTRAFGRSVGLAFAWAEFWIIRPGNIGAVAYVAANYLQQLAPLPPVGIVPPELLWSLGMVAVITALNLGGFTLERRLQNGLTVLKVLGIAAIVATAYFGTTPRDYQPADDPWLKTGLAQSFPLALVLIMFAYGGWSDMVSVAAEVREPQKNLFRALVLGLLCVMGVYLAVNQGFVEALGYRGLRNSNAVAAELMGLHYGETGRRLISALIVVSCLGSIHGMIFTSSRAFFAAGAAHPLLSWLGVWNAARGVPVRALVVQGCATVALILIFTGKNGFERLVLLTGPFYWGFLLLTALGLVWLRRKEPQTPRPYRVPFYPFTPIVFGLSCLALCYSAVDYMIDNQDWYGAIWPALVIVSGAIVVGLDRKQAHVGSPPKA